MNHHDRQSRDSSTLNPAGAARRRLIKAAGLGALTGVVSVDWRKPSVRIGALTAHAQGSNLCQIDYSVNATINPDVGGAISISLLGFDTAAQSQLLGSGVIFDSGAVTGSTVTGGTETYQLQVSASITLGNSDVTISLTQAATCCGDDAGFGFVIDPSGTDGTFAWPGPQVYPDDGNCNLILPL